MLAEWERIEQLLAGTTASYTPDTDPFVQEELAIEQRRQEAVQAELEVQQRLAERANELAQQASSPCTTMESRVGDEAARDHLALRGDWRVEKVDAWLAQALADHSGHYADPAARTAATATLPAAVRAHAALLSALARTGTPADVSKLPSLAVSPMWTRQPPLPSPLGSLRTPHLDVR
ncbi:hypothetical protein [Streptomyces sp. NPDC057429]|uniref:hypothetical protein n=1 Tax=Streptomyces sp. NPDC057429 TaxID=3346130 RepID=UPI003697808D